MTTIVPVSVRNLVQSHLLEILWSDQSTSVYSHRNLRERCRCTHCRSRAIRGAPPAGEGVALTDINPVGNYGVQLSFSDGHRRGIYPWAYLRELSIAGLRSKPLHCA